MTFWWPGRHKNLGILIPIKLYWTKSKGFLYKCNICVKLARSGRFGLVDANVSDKYSLLSNLRPLQHHYKVASCWDKQSSLFFIAGNKSHDRFLGWLISHVIYRSNHFAELNSRKVGSQVVFMSPYAKHGEHCSMKLRKWKELKFINIMNRYMMGFLLLPWSEMIHASIVVALSKVWKAF